LRVAGVEVSKLQGLHMQAQGSSAVDKCPSGIAHAGRSRTQAHAHAAPSARASTSKAHSGSSNSCSSSSEESTIHMQDAYAQTHMCTHMHTRTRTGWAKCPPGWCGKVKKFIERVQGYPGLL